jgi:ribonuclease R
LVHRLLKEEWASRQGRPVKRTPAPALEEVAALSSERERAAMEAEREIAGYYAALLMKDRVGEAFDGVVSAVTDFGFFVELRPMFVEGLVRAEDLPGDVELDPVRHALVDRASGSAYRVGDAVRVEVANASPARRQITLRLEGVAGVAGRSGDRAAEGAEDRASSPGARAPGRRKDARPERRPQKAGGPKAGKKAQGERQPKGQRPRKPGRRRR